MVSAGDEWIAAVEAHRELIAGETLATTVQTHRHADADGAEPEITVAVAH